MIVAAADIGAGGTAFLIVLALIVIMALVFWAMIHSFRRLRESVDTGTFGQSGKPGPSGSKAEDAVSPDQSPGGATV